MGSEMCIRDSAQTDYHNPAGFDADYICQYSDPARSSRDIAGLDKTANSPVTRCVDIGSADTQLAAVVYADDDAVDSAAGRFTRSRKVFHQYLGCLVIVQGLSRTKQKR